MLFYFYHEPILTPLLLLITLISFIFGQSLLRFPLYKKPILSFFLLAIASLYIPLKYNVFFETVIRDVLSLNGLRWLYLPLGLSYYSYKTLSYVFDIYFEKPDPQKSFVKYLLYISYFPQIFCGPIMGPNEFFSQLKFSSLNNYIDIRNGLIMIVIGTFKKIALASNLLLLINSAYNSTSRASGLEWVIISIITRFYIYYDFSGYSEISNGISLLFGIKVAKNFDLPFKSKSITEFWRRWHISLSHWIRDYVYYPLVSKFSSYAGIYLSLVISFICLGLWHGGHFNYLLYGFLNGVAVALSTYLNKKKITFLTSSRLSKILSIVMLYLFLIFLPSILLMTHKADDFYAVVKALTYFKSWFGLEYFKRQNFTIFVKLVIPLFIVFELISVFLGEKCRNKFDQLQKSTQLLIMMIVVVITFILIAPEVDYRFLYQGF
jgi:alginate O-acetyltransferase complex protein AlgI